MNRRTLVTTCACAILCATGSCATRIPELIEPPFETRFSLVNLSTRFYAVLGIRAHGDETGTFVKTPLLPPGAVSRAGFLDAGLGGCPDNVDLQLFLYQRVDESKPIGLDLDETVKAAPIVAGEILGLPYCSVTPLQTYTIVNWDAPEGIARVKIAQGSKVDDAIGMSGIFPNVDAAWEITGVDARLASVPPPPPAETEPIAGRVTLAGGEGIAGVGVLLRSRFRIRLSDMDESNDPDVGFSEPIAFTSTDESGAFSIDRPAGAYQIEFFADDLLFRPASVLLETPIEVIQIIAEELP